MNNIFDLGYQLVCEATMDIKISDVKMCDIHDSRKEIKDMIQNKGSLLNQIKPSSKGVILYEPKNMIFIGAGVRNEGNGIYTCMSEDFNREPFKSMLFRETIKLVEVNDSNRESIIDKIKKKIFKK